MSEDSSNAGSEASSPLNPTPLDIQYPPRFSSGPRRSNRLARLASGHSGDSGEVHVIGSDSSETNTPSKVMSSKLSPSSSNTETTVSLGADEGAPSKSRPTPRIPQLRASSKGKTPVASSSGWYCDSIESVLTSDDLDSLRRNYGIPDSISLRIPGRGEKPSSPPVGEIALNSVFFECGLRLPLGSFIRDLLYRIKLSPLQLHPNIWRGVYSCYVLWRELFGVDPSAAEVQACFAIRQIPNQIGSYYYYSRHHKRFLESFPETNDWQKLWFFAGGAFEVDSSELGLEPPIPCSFGGHNHGWSSKLPHLNSLSSSRLSVVMRLDLSDRDSGLLLMKERLLSGTFTL